MAAAGLCIGDTAEGAFPGRNGILAWGFSHGERCQDGRCHLALEIKALHPGSRRRSVLACNARSPAFSSDGRQLAFWRERDSIYTMPADGSQPPRPVPGTANSYGPRWSPGGRRLAFHVLPSGSSTGSNIYTIRVDGSGRQRLTSTGHDYGPIWGPNDKIAFTWEGRDPGVFVMNADGSGRRRVTRAPGPHPAGDPPGGAIDVAQSWSPDGRWIAFARLRRDHRWRIHVVRADGHRRRLVARGAAFAAWSPDGERIAVAPEHGRRIDTVRPDGTHRRRFAKEPRDGAPKCHNDHATNLADAIGFSGLDWRPLPR